MPWSGHQAATIDKFIRKETLAIHRKKAFHAALRAKGRETYDGSGPAMKWPVRYKRTGLVAWGDGDSHTFARQDKRFQASLPPRGYVLTQSINEQDKLINQGKEAIVKLWANAVKELLDDARFGFNKKLITADGYASGSEREIMGLESFFATNGTSSNNKIYVSGDTYAGHSTALAAHGGTWTGTWPDGNGDTQYDTWTPLIVKATGTGWTSATKTFAANSIEQLRYMIINTERNGYMLDMILLAKDYYTSHLANLDSKERITVERNGQSSGVVKTGFSGQIVNQDGIDIAWETDLTAATGYGLCIERLELVSYQPQLFKSRTDYDIETLSERALLSFYGNLKAEDLRCQSKILD